MFSFRLSHGPVCRILVAAAATAVLSTSVLGQDRGGGGGGGPGGGPGGGGFRMGGGPGGMGGMFGTQGSQAVGQADVDRYGKILNLTDAQKETFKKSYNAYTAQYQAEEAAMQERVSRIREEAQDTGDFTGMRNIATLTQEFRASATKMEEKLIKDLRRVLTEEQKASWTKLERARRRDKAAAGMMVASAERIDLVKIVEDMKLPAEVNASLAPTLDQYENELDKELINRAKVNDEVTAAMTEVRNNMQNPRNQGGGGPGGAGGPGGGGPGGFQQIMEKYRPVLDKARDASSKVQEVNRRYAAKVQSQLPEDRRPAFAKAVKEAKFPDVFRETSTQKRLAAALEFTDLDEKQKPAIKSLQSQYVKEVTSLNEKLATASEKDEARRLADPNLGFGRGPGGQGGGPGGRGGQGGGAAAPDPNSPNSLRQAKRDLDTKTMESLRKILTQDQQDRLPRADPRDRMGGGGGNFGGGGGGNNGGGQQQRRGRNGA